MFSLSKRHENKEVVFPVLVEAKFKFRGKL